MILTNEQKLIIKAAGLGKNFKIKAFAGTGKTTTLELIAKELATKKGLYIAYNKSIQSDAHKKFGKNVTCVTAHSLAYAFLKNRIKGRVKQLTLNIFKNICIDNNINLPSDDYYLLTLKTIRAYCNNASSKLNLSTLIKIKDEHRIISNENNAKLILESANNYWELVQKNSVPIEHDFYLKMFQLLDIELNKYFDFILFDEVQDASPVMLEIIHKQKCQKIYVGDNYQQIYAWRGAVNAIKNIRLPEYYLSESFRFGKLTCTYANKILSLKNEKAKLTSQIDITNIIKDVPETFTALCRTNLGLLDTLIQNANRKIFVIGGINEILLLLNAAIDLYSGNKTSHTKLSSYSDWQDLKHSSEKDVDLNMLVKLIESYQNYFSYLLNKINSIDIVQHENEANIVLSTIHKAKGREWYNVVIIDDINLIHSSKTIPFLISNLWDEFNLLYVAITRAKKNLVISDKLHNFFIKIDDYLENKQKDISTNIDIKRDKAKRLIESNKKLSHFEVSKKLLKQGLSRDEIKELNIVDQNNEINKAKNLIVNKYPKTKAKNEYEKKQKIKKYLFSKGFSFDHINKALDIYMKEQ